MAGLPNLHPSVPGPIPGQISQKSKSKVLPALDNFLNVAHESYDACLTHIDHEYVLNGFSATLRLHYVRFDNGAPKFRELAKALVNHLGVYAIMAQRHTKAKTNVDHTKIFQEAKRLLRAYSKSGEPGELLLYFLLEAVLRAPQAICKMSLKTNRKDEVKGSDGVHIRWDENQKKLIVYFGEAKLHQGLTRAIAAAFKSMETFHAERAEEHEAFLVSNHFNLLDNDLKSEVSRLLDKTVSAEGYEFQHACLVGFDWEKYGDLNNPAKRKAFVADFEKHYLEHGGMIHSALETRLKTCKHSHLTFEFFFIPFKSVQEFRDFFMEEVFGAPVK